VIETATPQRFDRPCWLRHPTGYSPSGSSLEGVVGEVKLFQCSNQESDHSIFSNALTLEELTSKYPNVGHLLTFFQFLVVAIHGLPKHLTITRWRGIPIPKFKPRQVPLSAYVVQVVLFCLLSILNNKAFSYLIPMPVHIIFRSGGLAVSMLMGRIFLRRRLAVLWAFETRILTSLSDTRPYKWFP